MFLKTVSTGDRNSYRQYRRNLDVPPPANLCVKRDCCSGSKALTLEIEDIGLKPRLYFTYLCLLLLGIYK